MIKYTITISTDQAKLTGYFESAYLLNGDEPEFQRRVKQIVSNLVPESDYMKTFKEIVFDTVREGAKPSQLSKETRG